ncbi:MAG: hypothetical protein V4537_13465 [Pseudomonadota bacterium]
MKPIVLAVALLTASPAIAQDHSKHAAAPAPAPVAPAPAAPAATTAKFTLDTPIETLMADPAAKAVVEASIPNITAHPSYDMAKSMSFNQVAPMAPEMFSAELLAKLQAGLAAIK